MRRLSGAEALERAVLEVVGYAVTSARALLDETPAYGPLRLLETARRTLDAVRTAGSRSSRTDDLREKIDAAVASIIEGEEAFRARLDAVVAEVLRLE